ncbi:MAG: Fe(2+) transporter permease subunit FeoB [Fibrobacterota bacterium]
MERLKIAIAGNPNSGKTTLFNNLTGARQRTGNWPGVTVDILEGEFTHRGSSFSLVDLPGIYSFSAFSEDERISRDYILQNRADLIINVLDGVNFERNMYLTAQLVEMGKPFLMVINKRDITEQHGIDIDTEKLSQILKVPVFHTSSTKDKRLNDLKAFIHEHRHHRRTPQQFSFCNEIEEELAKLSPRMDSLAARISAPAHWTALKLLEGDPQLTALCRTEYPETEQAVQEGQGRIEQHLKEKADSAVAEGRFAFINGLTAQTVHKRISRKTVTDRIDRILLNPILSLPFFLGIMYLTFWFTINLGGAFIDFFDGLTGTIFVEGSAALLQTTGSPEWLISLISQGLGGGIQTLSTFIPIIFTLFFIMSILEDSGYMARAAFIMDRFMRWIGLPGKAFVPLLIGFGCTVPAIMATRTLGSKRDRILTVFMSPFMSCGARLPVYALFAAAFWPRNGQMIVFSLYLMGIFFAILTGLLLKKTLFRGESSPFVMELPLYHSPRLNHIFLHTWIKLKGFIVDAGRILIIALTLLGFLNTIGTDGTMGNEGTPKSVLSVMGRATTPLFHSFGITQENWPASVGLFTGIFAKEVIVGTVNSLYQQDDVGSDADEEYDFIEGIRASFATIPANLKDAVTPATLRDPAGIGMGDLSDEEVAAQEISVERSTFSEMRRRFETPYAAYSYLLFVLLYLPCLVAVSAAYREIGKNLVILQIAYTTIFAWVAATLFYQISYGHSTGWIIAAVAAGTLTVGSIFTYSRTARID